MVSTWTMGNNLSCGKVFLGLVLNPVAKAEALYYGTIYPDQIP